ncbi:MAG: serine hydrolase domain-containing protein [Pseudomonadota bacterium]
MNLDHVDPEAAQFDAQALKRIDDHLQHRYLSLKKIPGYLIAVARGGHLAHLGIGGLRDMERGLPCRSDTLFRIYSMTKPVTSVALMTLWERGLLSLNDPVHRYLPEWKDLRVWSGGSWPNFETRAAETPMRIRDLLSHTSGLTYDIMRASNIDYAYRKLGVGRPREGYTLQSMVDQLAELPLEFSPGERWNYSIATDVLGVIIERISGQSLDQYLYDTIFSPLDMHDTGFTPRPDQVERLACSYMRDQNKKLILHDDGANSAYAGRSFYSGGGGLLSTLSDYMNFCQMLAAGGSFAGHRVIGRKTLELMTANHLPNNQDLAGLSISGFSESANEGVGFGLGFATKLDPLPGGTAVSTGTFYWGGLASTLFWVDPQEEVIVVFLTQLLPSSTFNFRGQLEALVYSALS